MKFKMERRGIIVTPETEQDVAYIEDTLGLEFAGDSVFLVRENAMGMNCISHLETKQLKREVWPDET